MLSKRDRILQYQPLWQGWMIEAFLGEGSYGRVYRAVRRDRAGKYRSAVKLISIPNSPAEYQQVCQAGMDRRSVYGYFDNMVSHILREINIMYALRGEPNIVTYEDHAIFHEKDTVQWDILIRMELLESLDAYRQTHPFSPREVARLGIELCCALEACAKKNILHRDIKGSNIFVDSHGTFKLGDFGIARALSQAESLSMRGTPAYIAPEVYKGQPYDATIDIYSLGILLYKYLNGGRYPFLPPAPQAFTHEDTERALRWRMQGASLPAPLFGSDALKQVVLRACAYEPLNRYQSAADMKAALFALYASAGTIPLELEQRPGDDAPAIPLIPPSDLQHPHVPGGALAGDETAVFGGGQAEADSARYLRPPKAKGKVKKGKLPAGIAAGCVASALFLLIILPALQERGAGAPPASIPAEQEPAPVSNTPVVITTPPPLPTPVPTPVATPEPTPLILGNTASNIENNGIAAIQNNAIFYSNLSDNYKLYSVHADGSGRKKLNDDISFFINVVGDWVYYCNGSDGNKIYAIKTDGTEKRKVNEDDSCYIMVAGEQIFYAHSSDGKEPFPLYTIKTDGSGRKKITDDSVSNINIIGDLIYYTNWTDGNKIYTINADGSNRKKLLDDKAYAVNIIDEWLYYHNGDEGGKLYAVKTDGSGKRKVCDDLVDCVCTDGEQLYYRNVSDGGKLYTIKGDGSGRKKLNNDNSVFNNVVGEYIYYYNQKNGYLYSIKIDGSDRQRVK